MPSAPNATAGAAHARRRRELVATALSTLAHWGYDEVDVPLLAPWDELRDAVPDSVANELFRFADRDGRLLVLRGDVTPVVAWRLARVAAERAEPMRISYAGGAARVQQAFARQQTESFALGAELWGAAGDAADLEAITVCVDVLASLGFDALEVHLGHAALGADLTASIAASNPARRALHAAIVEHDRVRVARLCHELDLDDTLCSQLLGLCALAPTPALLESVAADPRFAHVRAACEQLVAVQREAEAVLAGLAGVFLDAVATDDRGYYTGVRFRVICGRSGEVLAAGGRYDGLLRHFEADCPAVGFALRAERVLERASSADAPARADERLIDPGAGAGAALALALAERRAGHRVRVAHRGVDT
jgi:ATP phosphoribosyltransferase regulatory subunit